MENLKRKTEKKVEYDYINRMEGITNAEILKDKYFLKKKKRY
jgi:hypothetical protein